MKLVLTDLGGGKIAYAVTTTTYLDRDEIDALTDEQRARLEHHIGNVSDRVYAASAASMVKGVRKYGPEPGPLPTWYGTPLPGWQSPADKIAEHWFPHIFSEAVDCANQTGLFADALGVELCPK